MRKLLAKWALKVAIFAAGHTDEIGKLLAEIKGA
jgi:hypothetical protein